MNQAVKYFPELHHVKRAPTTEKIRVGSFFATKGAWDRKYQATHIDVVDGAFEITVRYIGRYFAKKAYRNAQQRYDSARGWHKVYELADYRAPSVTNTRLVIRCQAVQPFRGAWRACNSPLVHVVPKVKRK